MNQFFAYIPARGGSKRIARKNIRPLGDKPVLGHVIQSLKNSNLNSVCVSTEDSEISNIAHQFGAETLAARNEDLCTDQIGFLELVKEDVPRYCEHFNTNSVIFTLATAALVTPEIYNSAMDLFLEKRPALLLAVTKFPISPYWALVQNKNKLGWGPLFPEESKLQNQKHPDTVVDAGLFFIFDHDKCKNLENLLEADPLEIIEVPRKIAIDVDTEDDWKELEFHYGAEL